MLSLTLFKYYGLLYYSLKHQTQKYLCTFAFAVSLCGMPFLQVYTWLFFSLSSKLLSCVTFLCKLIFLSLLCFSLHPCFLKKKMYSFSLLLSITLHVYATIYSTDGYQCCFQCFASTKKSSFKHS